MIRRKRRRWNGSVLAIRGRYYIQVREQDGTWHQYGTGLLATPDNRAAAESKLAAAREAILALPELPHPTQTSPDNGSAKRLSFKRKLGLQGLACEVCGWKPLPPLRTSAINAHHIVRRKDGGTDDPPNLAALCPNCHAVAHGLNRDCSIRDRENLFGAIRAWRDGTGI